MQWWTALVLKVNDTIAPLPPQRCDSYDHGVKRATDLEERNTVSPKYRTAVLLDVMGASAPDPEELQRLIDTVPLFHAIYQLGLQVGVDREQSRRFDMGEGP